MEPQIRRRLRVALIVLVNGIVFAFATPAVGQGFDAITGQRLFGGFTEVEIEAMTPTSPNPFVSYLLAGMKPDYRYWNARTALESYRRAERRGELTPTAPGFTFYESEDPGDTNANDTYATADFVSGFGTGAEDFDAVVALSGHFSGSTFTTSVAAPFAEDDGAIPHASEVALGPGEGIRVEDAMIGDGPHGGTSGDFDFYAVTALAEGQTLVADVDTPESNLDASLALYDETGTFIAFNADADLADPYLELRLPAPGTYYVAAFGSTPGVPYLSDPFDAGSGPGAGSTGAYDLTLALAERDVDVFAIDLAAGDVLGVGEGVGLLQTVEVVAPDGTIMIGSGRARSSAYPADSPLPSEGPALVGASTVAHENGTYYVVLTSEPTETVEQTPYSVGVHAFRPRTETEEGATQVLFVDFDGATINAYDLFGGGNSNANLSPLADFLSGWGLELDEEDALIDRIMAFLEDRLHDQLLLSANNPRTEIVLLNSRDDADPGDAPYVSRLIIGGTMEELGIGGVGGVASATDPGNFGLEDIGVILLDVFSGPPDGPFGDSSLNSIPLAPGAEKIDLVAVGVGGIAAHEAGHFLGLWHTDTLNDVHAIEDEGGFINVITGLGPDLVFGTEDDIDVTFTPDRYSTFEGYVGVEDQANIVAFGLSQSLPTEAEGAAPAETAVAPLYPNPLAPGGSALLEIRSRRAERVRVTVYDVAGRLVRTAFEGSVAAGRSERVRIEARGLAAGTYLVRVEGERESAVRRLTVVR